MTKLDRAFEFVMLVVGGALTAFVSFALLGGLIYCGVMGWW